MAKPKKSPARAASTKKKVIPSPTKFHLDKRADLIVANSADSSDDELLTTIEMAQWLRCSVQWLEIGRTKGYGPPFERIGPRKVLYSRGKGRKWLNERSHRSTQEYA